MRNLTKTIAVVSLLAPASGHPLGIGDIKLHSALNQNLDADISLAVSAGENPSDIKVSLAPPDKFDEAGVPWTSFLSKIKFEPVVSANGSVVIKISSKEALKEPFLDFLLEVSWPKGSLYREFTVLVDPPSVYKEATIPVSTSAESYEPAPAFAPQQAMQASEQNGGDSAGEYGPTSKTDTLWSIAERASRESNVSVKQMMIAIYEANPHAFYDKNMYALTAGKTLKIPEREVILKLSRNQATAEFNRQTKAWKNRTAPAAAETVAAKTDAVDNQLTLDAPAEAPVAAENVVVAPGKEQVTAENKADNAPQKTSEAVDTLDGASGTVSADEAMQSKLAAMEKQMAMMQEMITLKDQQLAALQNQSQTVPAAQGQQNQTATAEVAVDSSADQAKPASQPVEKQVAQPETHPAVQAVPEAIDSSDLYYPVVGGIGTGVLSLLGWLWWRKRKVDEETNTESMFASSVMIKMPEAADNLSAPIAEDSMVYDVGTVGESSFLSEFTPSDFDSFNTDHGEIDPMSEADVYLAYGRYQQAEELIRHAIEDQPDRNECKLKLLEIFYANENKKSFEDYANELVVAGKKEDAEFWGKVAEMGRDICPDSALFSAGNDLFAVDDEGVENILAGDEFNAEGSMAAASVGESLSDDFAKETAEVKDSALDFDLTSFEIEDDSFIDEQRNHADIDFDLSSFLTDTKEADGIDETVMPSLEAGSGDFAKETAEVKDSALDFDLTSFEIEDDSFMDEQRNHADIDFDLSSFFTDTKNTREMDETVTPVTQASSEGEAPKEGALVASNAAADELESYEFDLGLNNAKVKEEFDLSSVDRLNKDYPEFDYLDDTALGLPRDGFGGDFDFNFDLDLDMPVAEASEQIPHQHDEFGVSDLTDMDELETKLDLAKAYIDMGDVNAAKDIAKEVLGEGTVEQKKMAQSLLDELN